MILGLMKKNASRFQVKIFEYAIQGNHLHLLVKAQSKVGLQNFFRVLAGHSAQKILIACPLPTLKYVTSDFDSEKTPSGAPKQDNSKSAGGAPSKHREGCRKNQRKFWSYLLFSRVISWGRDFQNLVQYVQKNTLELLQMIAYQPRNTDFRSPRPIQKKLQSTS
jgi:REP element-mobilizing transposase RayT